MSIVTTFNGLNGAKISRKEVCALIIEAEREEQYEVANRLRIVAENNSGKYFKFKINDPAIEIVPESLLHCLPHEQDNDDKIIGLGKAVSPNEIYQMITDRMIQLIQTLNKGYVKEWDGQKYGKGYLIPYNFVSKKPYRGINRFLLTDLKPLENPFYLTFKQVDELGGKIAKGAKGHEVVYFTQLYRFIDNKLKINVASYDIKKFIEMIEPYRYKIPRLKGLSLESFARANALPILKYYKVFNGKDIEGIDFKLADFKHGYIERELPPTEGNRLPVADAIINNYPAPQPKLAHGGDRAFYRPGGDNIQMPYLADFTSVQGYYRTLFHEFSHSTGSSNRLARDFSGSFGSKPYAFEELIAEFGATFLSAEAGILWHTNTNHAAYLKSWNSHLTHLKEDNRFLMRAATKAQEAADFVLQHDANGQPAYFKDIKPKTEKKKPVKAPIAIKTAESRKSSPARKKRDNPAQTKLALAGRKKEAGLNAPVAVHADTQVEQVAKQIEPIVTPLPVALPGKRKNPYAKSINEAGSGQPSEFFTVDGEIGKFLQQVEKKPVESVVITLDGQQGAGKTTTLYKMMNAFATPGNSCVFISGEEHPDSSLAVEKRDEYLSAQAREHIDILPGVKDSAQLYDLVSYYDIIFIDSWQKLQRMVGNIRLDEDLRKKFDGKVFVIIFQQTTEGRTKGGAEVVFDGDIIIKMVKEPSFADNYAYFDKNRYTMVPIETIRYNIASGKCYNPQAPKQEPQPELKPSSQGLAAPSTGLKFIPV